MKAIEALALKGTALRIQLREAEKTFQELFVTPVKAWLEGLPDKKATIAGIARPIISVVQLRPAIDEHLLMERLLAMVASGDIDGARLKQFVLDGSLGIGSPDLLLANICTISGNTSAGFMTDVAVGHPSLMWNCVREGLEDHLKFGLDLGSAVRSLAEAPVSDSFVAELEAKAVAATRDIDAKREARRRRPLS